MDGRVKGLFSKYTKAAVDGRDQGMTWLDSPGKLAGRTVCQLGQFVQCMFFSFSHPVIEPKSCQLVDASRSPHQNVFFIGL